MKKEDEYKVCPKGYYHLSSDGKRVTLFHDEQEYMHGMNTIALASTMFQIVIHSFTLMKTHIHMLLYGTGEEITKLFYFLRKRIKAQLLDDGKEPVPDNYWFKLVEVNDEISLRRHFVYIARNALEALPVLPSGYIWGSTHLAYSQIDKMVGFISADSLSIREMKSLLRSSQTVPGHYRIHAGLKMILPESYVDMTLFYKTFDNARQYLAALVKDVEGFVYVAEQLGDEIEYSVEDATELMKVLMTRLYPNSRFKDLPNDDKCKLVSMMYYQYHVKDYVISQTVFMNLQLVRQIVHSKQYSLK